MNDKILITGGAGFIGTNLAGRLEQSGYDVWIYDNLSRGLKEFVSKPEKLIAGDILDSNALQNAMKYMGHVIHLAAYGSVVESVTDPETNFDINVIGTKNVLECSRKSNIHRFIFASTGGALIGEATPPVDEHSLPKPISPYGASKLCGEAYCHSYAKAYGLQALCLRFANVYGPYSAHKKGAATKFMKCLLQNEPMPIFGDGSATRDFLHVQDLCEGIVLGLQAEVMPGEVVHLASGHEISIADLAKSIATVAGRSDHPIEYYPKRKGEVERNFARYDKAKERLGFAPQKDLRTGLKETWEWYLAHKEHVLAQQESDS